MNNHCLSKNLKHLRKLYGYTQEEISLYLQIKRQTYSLYERGQRIPVITILILLCSLYQISLDELVGKNLNALIPNKATLEMLLEYNTLPLSTQRSVQDFVKFQTFKNKKNLPSL